MECGRVSTSETGRSPTRRISGAPQMNYQEAKDELQKMVTDSWNTTGHPIFYEGVGKDRPEDTQPFARVWIRHTNGRQATLGGRGGRSFERTGLLTVQVYAPIGKGLRESYPLAKVVADTFEGEASPNGIWFRNVRINEVGKDGAFILTNVIIDFEYNEIK